MWRRLNVLAVSTLLLVGGAQAQVPVYTPTYANPFGSELVAVYISSSHCVGNLAPGLREAVEQAKVRLGARAKAEGRTFRAVGVALDWAPDSGLAYLRGFGQFDELVIGSNWFNVAATMLIFADSTGVPSIPQLIVYERTINVSNPRRLQFGQPRVLRRVVGGDSIVVRVKDGTIH
jgi:hypothetical protein